MSVHHWKFRNESSVEPSPASNEEYHGNKLVTISIVFMILNTIFVILRCYSRSITKVAYCWDDYLIFASYISNISLCAASICTYALFIIPPFLNSLHTESFTWEPAKHIDIVIVYNGGVGRHISDVLKDDPELVIGWAKGIFAIELIYLASVALPKLSALCFYMRIFVCRKSRIFACTVMGFVILNWAVFSISAIIQCRPVAYWWDKSIQGGVCFNVQTFYRAMCVPNIATDVIVLLLPISSLIQLKLPLLKKAALCFIFLTASVWVPPYADQSYSDASWSLVLEACSHPYIDSQSSLPPMPSQTKLVWYL